MKKLMGPGEMLFRIGVGAVLVIVGLLLQAAWVSFAIFMVGVAWIGWTVYRAVRQVRAAEEILHGRRSGAERPSPNNRNRGSAAKAKPLISFKLGAIIVAVALVLIMLFQAWMGAESKRLGTAIKKECVDAALRQGVEVEVTDTQPFVNDEMFAEKDEYRAEAEVSNGTRTFLVEMHCTVRYTSESKENVDSVDLYFE